LKFDFLTKKIMPKKSKEQIRAELEALKGCLQNLKEAQESLLKTDFAYQAELNTLQSMRANLARRITSIEDYLEANTA
jgi:hypothetical protein